MSQYSSLSDSDLQTKFEGLVHATTDKNAKALCEAFLQRFQVKVQVNQALVQTSRTAVARQPSSTATMNLVSKFKLDKPSPFEGTSSDLSNFIFQITNFLDLGGVVSDTDRIQLAATFLKGKALTWWRGASQLPDYQQRNKTFSDWIDDLTRQFQDVDHILRYRRKLSSLRQTGSVTSYTAAFRTVLLELGKDAPNDGDQLFAFIEGLKDEVRKEVYLERPTLFSDAIEIAERADSALYSNRQRVRRDRQPGQGPMDWSPGTAHFGGGQPGRGRDWQGRGRGLPGPPPRGGGGRQPGRGSPTVCWNCGKEGHLRRDCQEPQKN